MDRVRKTLSALESGELPNFYLDGQAVVIEDVLAIEPKLETNLRETMKRGLLGRTLVRSARSISGRR